MIPHNALPDPDERPSRLTEWSRKDDTGDERSEYSEKYISRCIVQRGGGKRAGVNILILVFFLMGFPLSKDMLLCQVGGMHMHSQL